MKKILSSFFLLLILLFILFSLSGWYFGASAEQAFKEYLQKNTETSVRRLLRFELQSYKRTLFGAKAKLTISSDIQIVAEQIGEITFTAKLLNGPIFITKSGVSVGSSRWFISLDEDSLSPSEKENVRAIFSKPLPRIIVRTDFKKHIHYRSRFKTNLAETDVIGVFDSVKESNSGKIMLSDFSYDLFATQIRAKKISMNYQYEKGITSAYKPGKTTVRIPELKVQSKALKKSISLDIDATGTISQVNSYFNSFTKLNIKKIANKQDDKELPIDKANLSLMLKGISSDSFLRYNEIKAKVENLKQQAQWSLQEKGEYPEGQDQIWQLYNEIDASSQILPSIILKEMFNEDSLIQLKVKTFNSAGESELVGELKKIDTAMQKTLKTGMGGFNTIISLLQGEARAKLDKDLFQYLQNFSPIKQSEFGLILKDSKLLMH